MQIVEYPKPGFIRLPKFLEGMAGVAGARLGAIESESAALTYEARVLQAILDRPGQPLLLAPGEILPAEVEPLR